MQQRRVRKSSNLCDVINGWPLTVCQFDVITWSYIARSWPPSRRGHSLLKLETGRAASQSLLPVPLSWLVPLSSTLQNILECRSSMLIGLDGQGLYEENQCLCFSNTVKFRIPNIRNPNYAKIWTLTSSDFRQKFAWLISTAFRASERVFGLVRNSNGISHVWMRLKIYSYSPNATELVWTQPNGFVRPFGLNGRSVSKRQFDFQTHRTEVNCPNTKPVWYSDVDCKIKNEICIVGIQNQDISGFQMVQRCQVSVGHFGQITRWTIQNLDYRGCLKYRPPKSGSPKSGKLRNPYRPRFGFGTLSRNLFYLLA